MYRKCIEMYKTKMYKEMYRNCAVLDKNVQRMYRNFVMDLVKNGPNHVIGLGGAPLAISKAESVRCN